MIRPAIALAAVWLLATTVGPTSTDPPSDLGLYAGYADQLSQGRIPYRDFAVEYPPLALVPIWLGAALGLDLYAWCFGALMLGAMLVVQREAARMAGSTKVAWALVLLPVALGAIVRTRFDLVPVALALVGLRLVLQRRDAAGFVVLGLGVATKLFPGVVAALAVAWLLGAGERRAALRGATVTALTVAAIFAPFAALAPERFADQFEFHLERPVQVESMPATVLWTLERSVVVGTAARPDRFRSQGLAGGPADLVAAIFAVLQIAAVAAALLWARAAGRRADADGLVVAALAALTAFVVLGKVLSPQFLLWLVPLAAVAWTKGARAPAALVGVAAVLTQVEFPARYWDLVAGDPAVIALTGVRNAVLLAALSVLLARAAAPARSRRPVPATSSG